MVPNAKSSVAWLDESHLVLKRDWGDDSLTDSGYPRIVKMWQHDAPLADAKTIHSGAKADVGVWPFVMHEPGSATPMIARAMTFYTSSILSSKTITVYCSCPFPNPLNLKVALPISFSFL